MTTSYLRYPGVRPFEKHERHLFFGRARDVADLYDLILLEKMLVLFGKSGYGKSSLIKAGIIPLFTEATEEKKRDYYPIEVRFGNYIEGKSAAPASVVVQNLEKKLPVNPETVFLDSFFENQTSLWYECKRRQASGNLSDFKPADSRQYLFIFDQFEEFFSYPPEQQEEFRVKLAEALYESIPQKVRDAVEASDALTSAQRDFLAAPFDVKVVFSIRADRLSLLDGMKDHLPGILHKRYELRALDEKQARSAIIRPAAMAKEEGDFATPAFTFEPQALNLILQNLSTGKGGGIEAFQLQIVCQHLERQVQKGLVADRDGDGTPDIFPEDLPNFETVYEDYYNDKLHELDPSEEVAARAVIEDGLLFVNAATGEARRLSKDPDELVQDYGNRGVTHALLRTLEATYLLRREANTLGGFNYEISHDTLIAPITKAREIRRREAERRLTARRRRRALTAVAATSTVAAGAIALALWALAQKDEAQRQESEAVKQRTLADSLLIIAERERYISDSLLIITEKQRDALQAALDARDRAEYLRKLADLDRLLNEADVFIRAREYRNALYKLDEAEQLDIPDPRIEQRRTRIKKENQ
jgi:hypothetical protein